MDKFFVLRGGRVVYSPGHNDREGAVETAKYESWLHPKSVVSVVRVEEEFQAAPETKQPGWVSFEDWQAARRET